MVSSGCSLLLCCHVSTYAASNSLSYLASFSHGTSSSNVVPLKPFTLTWWTKEAPIPIPCRGDIMPSTANFPKEILGPNPSTSTILELRDEYRSKGYKKYWLCLSSLQVLHSMLSPCYEDIFHIVFCSSFWEIGQN